MARLILPGWAERQPEASPNAPWLKLYRHEGARFGNLPLLCRGLFGQLLKLTDETGSIELADGLEPWQSVCRAMGAHKGERRTIRKHLDTLIGLGFVLTEGVETEAEPDADGALTAPYGCTDGALPVHQRRSAGALLALQRRSDPELSTRNHSPRVRGEEKREEHTQSECDDLSPEHGRLKRLAKAEFARRFEAKTGAAYMLGGRHDDAIGTLAAAATRQAGFDGAAPEAVLRSALDRFFADPDPFVAKANWAPSVMLHRWAQYATSQPDPEAYVPPPVEDPDARLARLRASR